MVFGPLQSLVGGALIGGSAGTNALLVGRVTGISGICQGLLTRSADWRWRGLFVAGLVSGGVAFNQIDPASLPRQDTTSGTLVRSAVAGALVGVGSAIGNGCTSGHGVCGLARLSPRSLAHVVTFMGVGMLSTKVFGTVAAVAPPGTHPPAEPVWANPRTPTRHQWAVVASGLSIATVSAVLCVLAVRAPRVMAARLAPKNPSELQLSIETNRAAYYASHVTAYASGLLFSVGLVLGGMTDPHKVASFLDILTVFMHVNLYSQDGDI